MNMRPHAYADIARHLSARGFGVLRMAKVGPGTGSRVLDPAAAVVHNAFLTRVDVAAAGLDWIRHRVAARPVIVAGHSEGAVVASLLARSKGNAIDGVVSLSGPALPILEILRAQVAAQPTVSVDMTVFDELIRAIRAGQAPSAEARSHPHTALLASMPAPALAYLRSADEVDPVDALARVRQPVLIVQGGRDDSVPPHHAKMLRAGRGALPTQDAYFPALTHFYKIAPPGLSPMAAMALEGESDPAVAKAIAEWARRLR
jgi:alpha-beta hydrolase superfamily lysophospholipase